MVVVQISTHPIGSASVFCQGLHRKYFWLLFLPPISPQAHWECRCTHHCVRLFHMDSKALNSVPHLCLTSALSPELYLQPVVPQDGSHHRAWAGPKLVIFQIADIIGKSYFAQIRFKAIIFVYLEQIIQSGIVMSIELRFSVPGMCSDKHSPRGQVSEINHYHPSLLLVRGQTENPWSMESPSTAESCVLISLLVPGSHGFLLLLLQVGFKFFMTGKLYFLKPLKTSI